MDLESAAPEAAKQGTKVNSAAFANPSCLCQSRFSKGTVPPVSERDGFLQLSFDSFGSHQRWRRTLQSARTEWLQVHFIDEVVSKAMFAQRHLYSSVLSPRREAADTAAEHFSLVGKRVLTSFIDSPCGITEMLAFNSVQIRSRFCLQGQETLIFIRLSPILEDIVKNL